MNVGRESLKDSRPGCVLRGFWNVPCGSESGLLTGLLNSFTLIMWDAGSGSTDRLRSLESARVLCDKEGNIQ